MAYHWQHIKAFKSKETETPLYTFIEFMATTTNDDPPVSSSETEKALPEIITQVGDDNTSICNYGHILTSDVITNVLRHWTFHQGWNAHNDCRISANSWLFFSTAATSGLFYPRIGTYSTEPQRMVFYGEQMSFISSDDNLLSPTYDFNKTAAYFKPSLTINSSCTAKYFNATSDIRAKENLIPITQSMLDIVNHIELYTFNYKSDPSKRSFGLIAQQLQDINIDGFNFVDNQDATGENDDFMSIKESKLIYMLIGAVQELSAEVKRLKEKVGE